MKYSYVNLVLLMHSIVQIYDIDSREACNLPVNFCDNRLATVLIFLKIILHRDLEFRYKIKYE